MRGFLILNIVLCVFVLVIGQLTVLVGDVPVGDCKSFLKDHSLGEEAQTELIKVVLRTVEIQREKTWHKIVLPQIACGMMLLTNVYMLVKFKKSKTNTQKQEANHDNFSNS